LVVEGFGRVEKCHGGGSIHENRAKVWEADLSLCLKPISKKKKSRRLLPGSGLFIHFFSLPSRSTPLGLTLLLIGRHFSFSKHFVVMDNAHH
jgi:hypothetical protein